MKISPSILDADFESLQSEVNSIASADRIHLDIMDGQYVERKTFRASDIQHVEFPLPIEAHLMVNDPKSFLMNLKNLV